MYEWRCKHLLGFQSVPGTELDFTFISSVFEKHLMDHTRAISDDISIIIIMKSVQGLGFCHDKAQTGEIKSLWRGKSPSSIVLKYIGGKYMMNSNDSNSGDGSYLQNTFFGWSMFKMIEIHYLFTVRNLKTTPSPFRGWSACHLRKWTFSESSIDHVFQMPPQRGQLLVS